MTEVVIDADTEPLEEGDFFSGDRTGPDKVWHLRVSRKLTDDEMSLYAAQVDGFAWNKEDANWDLPLCAALIQRIASDVEIVAWYHAPFLIWTKGLYLPPKIYEIEHAMSLADAKSVAERTWKEQYKHLGMQGTFLKCRKATKKDMKKFQEVPKEPLT